LHVMLVCSASPTPRSCGGCPAGVNVALWTMVGQQRSAADVPGHDPGLPPRPPQGTPASESTVTVTAAGLVSVVPDKHALARVQPTVFKQLFFGSGPFPIWSCRVGLSLAADGDPSRRPKLCLHTRAGLLAVAAVSGRQRTA
jgi:hypothetical protein